MKPERGLNIRAVLKQNAYEKHLKELAERKAMEKGEKIEQPRRTEKAEERLKQVNLKLTSDMIERIKEKIKDNGLTFSAYIRKLVEEDLKNEK